MRVASRLGKSQVLVAAIATGLSFSAKFCSAGGLPYSTSFEQTSDAQGQTYTQNNLVGQNGWINEVGEPASGATVVGAGASSGVQAVQLTTPGTSNGFEDFYSAALADHPGYNGNVNAGYTGTGTPLVPGASGIVNIAFSMNHNLGSSGDYSGLEVFDSHDNVIASLFAATSSGAGNPNGPQNDIVVYDSSTTPGGIKAANFIAGVPDGTYGNYALSLNFNTETFTSFVNGQSYTTGMGANTGAIGGIAFAMYDAGNTSASANFDGLSVVPEPASLSMMGIGGLLMLARRRKPHLA